MMARVPSATPLWLDEPYAPRHPLPGPLSADVAVVGAGIGGIATAWRLLERGITPVVLEAGEVACGASGRNGGFFIAGAAPMYHETVERWGRERARAVHSATLRAQEEMLAAARAIGAGEHFRLDGMLRLGMDAAEAEDVRRHHAALAADGFPGELTDDLPRALQGPGRLGLRFPHDGAVHPARWIRALAVAAQQRGAQIFEHTRVTAVEPGAVVTEHGRVTAGHVVVAMDAALATLVPGARSVRSRRLNMVATAPVAERVLPSPVYARHGYEYAQQLPDGRVTLGGFSDLDGDASWTDRAEVSAPVQERLDAYLREELGVDAPVTHRWAGLVGYGEDALPRCGAAPGSDGRVLALGGYNGTGHVQAWVAAGLVAAAIAGDPPAPALYAPVG
jgi:gamma-glutamylputrescine oxidase